MRLGNCNVRHVRIHAPKVGLVILASMLMTALDCLYTPTFRAYFPGIVRHDELPSVNSAIQVIEDISSIIGPLIFSLIAILLAPSYAFAFFSVSLLISTASILTLLSSKNKSREPFNLTAIFKNAARSVGSLRKSNRPLFSVICCTTVCAMLATSLIRFMLPIAVIEHFQSDAAVGYIFSLLALGTVMGGLLYVNATERPLRAPSLFTGCCMALFFLYRNRFAIQYIHIYFIIAVLGFHRCVRRHCNYYQHSMPVESTGGG